MAHRVVVLDLGQVVEQGPALQVLDQPQHPLTQRLVQAMPATLAPSSL
jgi:peptide/nickel transport system ATP-binding protein